jgi:endonuclease III
MTIRPPAALRRKAQRVDRALEAFYGPPPRRRQGDAVSTLVQTILSQNTSDANSGRAFERLRSRFFSWAAVRDAPVEAVIEALRPAGLAALRAPRIQTILRRVTGERGAPSLDFLRAAPVERARAWLRRLDGVGPKTAAIVLVFGLGKPAFAVDTHVYRVGRRIGLIPERLSVEQAHVWMEALVARARYAPFHLLLVRHGREVCKASRPRCALCPARGMCEFFATANATSQSRPVRQLSAKPVGRSSAGKGPGARRTPRSSARTGPEGRRGPSEYR